MHEKQCKNFQEGKNRCRFSNDIETFSLTLYHSAKKFFTPSCYITKISCKKKFLSSYIRRGITIFQRNAVLTSEECGSDML